MGVLLLDFLKASATHRMKPQRIWEGVAKVFNAPFSYLLPSQGFQGFQAARLTLPGYKPMLAFRLPATAVAGVEATKRTGLFRLTGVGDEIAQGGHRAGCHRWKVDGQWLVVKWFVLGNRLTGAINRLAGSADIPGSSFALINVSDGIPDSLSLSLIAFVFSEAGQSGRAVRVQVHNHPGQVTHPHSQGVDFAQGVVSFSGHRVCGHRWKVGGQSRVVKWFD